MRGVPQGSRGHRQPLAGGGGAEAAGGALQAALPEAGGLEGTPGVSHYGEREGLLQQQWDDRLEVHN